MISQKLEFAINAGYGSYELDEIKSFQTDVKRQYPDLDIRCTECFPDNIFYSFAVNYILRGAHKIGIKARYNTTGGRNHIADYSGEYQLDMILNGYQIGLNQYFCLKRVGQFKFFLGLEEGIALSNLSIVENLDLFETNVFNDENLFKSNNFYMQPSFALSYEILSNICLNCNLGYEFNFKEKLFFKDNDDLELRHMSGDNVLLDWSGGRLEFGISYFL